MRERLIDGERGPQAEADQSPSSGRVSLRSLSAQYWNLDWTQHLPACLTDDEIAVHASSYDASAPFIKRHYRDIFQEDGASVFSTARLDERKARYLRLAGDFFEIKECERTIGLVVGTPVDWSTYYIRSAAVLPEYRHRSLAKSAVCLLLGPLATAGVERVEADTSPSNLCVVHVLTSLGFNLTGSLLSERWGAQVRFTRFLDAQSEDVFLDQFCMGVAYQLRDRVQRAANNTGPERRRP